MTGTDVGVCLFMYHVALHKGKLNATQNFGKETIFELHIAVRTAVTNT